MENVSHLSKTDYYSWEGKENVSHLSKTDYYSLVSWVWAGARYQICRVKETRGKSITQIYSLTTDLTIYCNLQPSTRDKSTHEYYWVGAPYNAPIVSTPRASTIDPLCAIQLCLRTFSTPLLNTPLYHPHSDKFASAQKSQSYHYYILPIICQSCVNPGKKNFPHRFFSNILPTPYAPLLILQDLRKDTIYSAWQFRRTSL